MSATSVIRLPVESRQIKFESEIFLIVLYTAARGKLFGPQLREWLREKLSSYEDLYATSSLAYDRDDSFILPASALPTRRVEGRSMAAEGRFRAA